MRILCNILVVLFVTATAVGQQINPVPDYIFRNSMSVGRNAPTDTSAYFSIGPRFGATRGFMPPMVVDTAAVTGTKRNGLLIYSIQRNSFLYWDSTGSRWSRIAANLDTLLLSTRAWRQKGIDSVVSLVGSGLTGAGINGYMTRWSGTKSLDTSRIFQGNGNIAIGTTSPDAIFHVARANAGGVGGQVVIDNPAASTLGNTAEISFITDVGASGAVTRNARILAVNESATFGNANMQFHTFNGSASGERMRISSAGSVGIGTASPAYLLDVSGTMRNTGNAFFNTTSGESLFGTTTDAGDYRVQIAGGLYNTTGGVLAATSGNVGIGTSSVASAYKLGVQDAINISGTNPYLNFNPNSANATSKAYIQYQESAKQLAIASSDTSTSVIVFQTGNPVTTKMTITGPGNVGIGKTPVYRLDVNGSIFTANQVYANNTAKSPTNDSTLSNGTIYSMNGVSFVNNYGIGQSDLRNSKFDIWFQTGSVNGGGYRWYIGTSEKMTIDNTGKLGIGTTSPSEVLHVVGRARVTTIDSSASPINMLWADVNGVVRKAPVPSASISGGTTDFIPLWSSSTALTSSVIKQLSSEILVGYTTDQGTFKLQVDGNTFTNGSIKTAAPSGGTAAEWKLGIVVAGSYTAASNYLQVDVGGTLYYIGLVTPN